MLKESWHQIRLDVRANNFVDSMVRLSLITSGSITSCIDRFVTRSKTKGTSL